MIFTKYLKEKKISLVTSVGFENDKSKSKYDASFSEGVRTNNAHWQDFINKCIKIMWDEVNRSLCVNILQNKSLSWVPVRQRHGANRGSTIEILSCLTNSFNEHIKLSTMLSLSLFSQSNTNFKSFLLNLSWNKYSA